MLQKHKIKFVIIYALLAALTYAVLGLLIKSLTVHLPNEVIVFFRQVFSLLTLSPMLLREYSMGRSIKTHRVHLHILRAGSALASMYLLFYALKYLPVADAIVLSCTRPLFIPFVVWLWMGKRLDARVWWGLFVGFLGVLCIVKPTNAVLNFAALAGLGSGLCGALAFTATRKLAKRETATNIVFYYLIFTLPISAIPLLYAWQTPALTMWMVLFGIGLLATFYQSFIAVAYQYGHTSKVASVLYSSVVFALILDWIVWSEMLGLLSLAGIALICLGCLIVVRDKNSLPSLGE